MEVPEKVIAELDPIAGHMPLSRRREVLPCECLERLAVVDASRAQVGREQTHDVEPFTDLHAHGLLGRDHQVTGVVGMHVEVGAEPAVRVGVDALSR